MPELPKHTPPEALAGLPPAAVRMFRAMDDRNQNQGTVTLGPYTYAEATAVSLAQANKAYELARTQTLFVPTACAVGVSVDQGSGLFHSVVRYRRYPTTPLARDPHQPLAEDVIREFPDHARGALGSWLTSGKNTAQVDLGPFDLTLAGAVAVGVLPIALDLASTESPYTHPNCAVWVKPGAVAWDVVAAFTTFDSPKN